MKKVLFIAITALMVGGFVSCNKDLELNGTTWEGTSQEYYIREVQSVEGDSIVISYDSMLYEQTVTLAFTSESNGMFTVESNEGESYVGKYQFSYAIQGKGGIINYLDEYNNALSITFAVNDDEMRMSSFDLILKKQK
ncbi:MAG: hypothetical protein SPJ13_06625 [Bacteroidales bacterium]|nr:hypothetical protein [Bacteroidales bacterium]